MMTMSLPALLGISVAGFLLLVLTYRVLRGPGEGATRGDRDPAKSGPQDFTPEGP